MHIRFCRRLPVYGLILMAMTAAGVAQGATGEAAAVIGPEAQLFVDDVMIARKEGVVRKAHACDKLEAPVLRAEKPWERTDIDRRIYVYGTVLPQEDGSGYRMWYMRFPNVLNYAVSDEIGRAHV